MLSSLPSSYLPWALSYINSSDTMIGLEEDVDRSIGFDRRSAVGLVDLVAWYYVLYRGELHGSPSESFRACSFSRFFFSSHGHPRQSFSRCRSPFTE